MQTVLGLVMHRFDIHIKRETGCFDVCVCVYVCVCRGVGGAAGPRGLLK